MKLTMKQCRHSNLARMFWWGFTTKEIIPMLTWAWSREFFEPDALDTILGDL